MLYSVKPLCIPCFHTALENFLGSQVQGSITLLTFNMSRMVAEYFEALANHFGDINKENNLMKYKKPLKEGDF